tara:strand:- start:60 stop:308 length:249 start_codon:yes stop_codon:yes gene_type:complete
MKIYYFSWIRERLNLSSENFSSESSTISELINELRSRDIKYKKVFDDLSVIKVAVNQNIINDFEFEINNNSEVAFFPPMTGG